MGRNVSSGSLVRAQVDLFFPSGTVNRVTGVELSTLSVSTFCNNALLAWPVTDGTSVQDSSISGGRVYFNEIPGSPGFYAIRLFPDRVGFWRVVVKSVTLSIESIIELDVSAPAPQAGGLNASFTK